MQAQRRLRRWFRRRVRRRRHRVVIVGVVGVGIVVGRDIVGVRIAGVIMIVGIRFRVLTMFVRRAHDGMFDAIHTAFHLDVVVL